VAADADPGRDLLVHGFVTLYRRPAVLERAIAALAGAGYRITVIDAAAWRTDADLHTAVAAALHFPAGAGANLDALADSLRDVADDPLVWPPDARGLVLVFTGYDAFAGRSPRTAQVVLDIIAGQGRTELLAGRRLIALVQSDDPRIAFDPVGATPVDWNDTERRMLG
jgi:hypothetical protein